jgi:hypothetical protein
MADRMPERTQSPAFLILRASTRRLLKFIEAEVTRNGGCARIFDDQFAVVGSNVDIVPSPLSYRANTSFLTAGARAFSRSGKATSLASSCGRGISA